MTISLFLLLLISFLAGIGNSAENEHNEDLSADNDFTNDFFDGVVNFFYEDYYYDDDYGYYNVIAGSDDHNVVDGDDGIVPLENQLTQDQWTLSHIFITFLTLTTMAILDQVKTNVQD